MDNAMHLVCYGLANPRAAKQQERLPYVTSSEIFARAPIGGGVEFYKP
jgi:hypothetical protein